MPKPQKPRRRKAKTGGSQGGGPGGKAAPPSAAEVAASERFDAVVAKGGAAVSYTHLTLPTILLV